MAFDFDDAKRRFAASRRIHPSVVEELIAAHEEALGVLRDLAMRDIGRTNACPSCGPLAGRGEGHARGCRVASLLGLR